MIILDTCILIFDALSPEKLSPIAKKTIIAAEKKSHLFCSSISLWEIAMLIQKKRLNPGIDTKIFLNLILQARKIQTLTITPEIAALSTSHSGFNHFDPADRLIAATTISHDARLITCDTQLHQISELSIIW